MNFDFGNILSNSIFWICLVCAAIVIYAAYHFIVKRKPRQQTKQQVENVKTVDEIEINKKVPAVVLDSIDGTYSSIDIDRSVIDDLAKKEPIRILKYNDKSVVYLNRYFDETECVPKYRTVASIERTLPVFVTPSELYQDQNQTEVGIAVRKLAESDNKSMMDQLMPYMPYILAMVIVAFLWAMA